MIVCGLLLLMGSGLYAQTIRVTGRVTDAADGSTLPGVSVVVRGTTIGTVTDINGRYEINAASDAVLQFSFIGMTTRDVPVQGRTVLNVTLESATAVLDEILVVAYGTARRGSFTGAATQITAEKIEARPISNITRALEGQVAGIQVTSGSGQPGSGSTIRIRGTGSINASNDPLYVVDGVPYALPLSNLNPDEIESISVLKDASATALYGSRGANGVILITTKRGTRDRSTFQVRATQGISVRGLEEYDLLGPEDWVRMAFNTYVNHQVFATTGARSWDDARLVAAHQHPTLQIGAASPLSSMFDGGALISGVGRVGLLQYNPFNVPRNQVMRPDGTINPDAKLIYSPTDLDWENELMGFGDRREYSMQFSGGTAKSDFFASGSYLDEKGYLLRSGFKRVGARLNANHQATDWFRTGVNVAANMSFSENARDGSSTGFVNPFFVTRTMGPIYPVYAHEPITGNLVLDANGKKIWDLGNLVAIGLPNRPTGASPGRHVLAETLLNQDEFRRNVISARTFGEVKFLNHFTFTVNASVDVNSYFGKTFDNTLVGDGAPAGRADRTISQTTSLNFNQLLNYSRTFNRHSIDVLLGHESYDWDFNYVQGFRQNMVVDGNYELINFSITNSLTSYLRQYRNEGYLSRLNYSFDDKYFLSGSFRYDGSSRFYKDVRWGTFWSVGAGWRMDRETFIRNIPQINMLMLRASYGEVGNDGMPTFYSWQSLYGLGWNNAGEPGFLQSTLPATQLTWESNNTVNVGIEFGAFNRVRGNVEFYHRISDNLLFEVPIPVSAGLTAVNRNIGTMYNQGIEARIATDIIANSDFRWTIDINGFTNKNRITKMPPTQPEIIIGTKKRMEGHSFNDYWLRQWYGVDPADGRGLYYAQNTRAATNIRIFGTDTLTVDAGNAKFDWSGTANPTFVGGLTNIFGFKNLEFSFLFTYQFGGLAYDSPYQSLMAYGDWGSAMHQDQLRAWKQPGDITEIPRMDHNTNAHNNAASNRWLIDQSFLNLRSVNVSYTLPTSVIGRIKASSARIYATAENLFLVSARKGLNLQENFAGTSGNFYTPARIFTFGINVSF